MHHLRKVSFITTSVLTRCKRCDAMTSCYEGQPERLEFPSNIPCPRNCKHRLATSLGEGGTQQFLYGEALYTIFHEKGAPFVYLLLTNGTPFTFLV